MIFKRILMMLLVLLLTGCNNVNELSTSNDVYTIVVASDTQVYPQKHEDIYCEMFKKVVENKDKYDIRYLIHAGDIVQNPSNDAEWQVAKKAISQLDGFVPYGVLAGNHDQDTGELRFEKYGTYFGEANYKDKMYFGESLNNCQAYYELLEINDKDFIVVYISDDPSKECIEFANKAFKKHSDHIGILVTHKYLKDDLSLDKMGEYMLEKIIKNNENVRLVVCGHESAVGYHVSIVDDRRVYEIIANYQDRKRNGTMMYLQVNEKDSVIRCFSFSPVDGSYGDECFEIECPW